MTEKTTLPRMNWHRLMIEARAYPDGSSYAQRCVATYTPGQAVVVGPAYQSGGLYAHDSHCGRYYVVRRLTDSQDYYLARHPEDVVTGDWALICHASRLRLAVGDDSIV